MAEVKRGASAGEIDEADEMEDVEPLLLLTVVLLSTGSNKGVAAAELLLELSSTESSTSSTFSSGL